MKKTILFSLLGLYLVFVSIDVLTAFSLIQALPNIILKLLFVLGCVLWIHLNQKDSVETVDFDFVRLFLILMFVTDSILGILAKIEGLVGDLFFITGIVSASFGQLVLILRHIRLALAGRLKSIGAISPKNIGKTQLGYFSIFVLVEVSIFFIGLTLKSLDSLPFIVLYVLISLASLFAAFAYLLSKNQKRSRLLVFGGVLLLIISDSFLGVAALGGDSNYLNLIVWASYAPVLLLIGASILQFKPEHPAKAFGEGRVGAQ